MDSPLSPHNSSPYLNPSRLVACRECRRSKIRCSRVFPCEACTRRGCADICPDGIKETKRLKSDDTLLHENARLMRRIRHLEGILLSLNPAGPSSSGGSFLNTPSPCQESQSYEISPSSDFSDPILSDVLGSLHEHGTISEPLILEPAPIETGNHENSHPRPGGFDLAHVFMRTLETHLTQNKTILAPGCQFVLQALLELCRSCGVTDGHSPSDKHTLSHTPVLAALEGHQSLFSSPAPASSPSSCGPFSETPPSRSDSDGSPENLASKNGTGQVVWNFTDVPPTLPSSSMEDRVPPTPLHVLGQFGEYLSQSCQLDAGHSNEPMSAELCQGLLVELGIVEKE